MGYIVHPTKTKFRSFGFVFGQDSCSRGYNITIALWWFNIHFWTYKQDCEVDSYEEDE